MMEMFAIYDKAVGAFMAPFFCRSKGEAVRSFMDACSDGKTNFCQHPDDFRLFHLGSFDDVTGVLHSDSSHPARVIDARECVNSRKGMDDGSVLPPVDVIDRGVARPTNGR